MTPGFLSISNQVAQNLSDQITRGTWRHQLPSESLLAAKFRVSRKTIRAALTELRAQGLVVTKQGVGTRIVSRGRRPSATRPTRIGLLLPESLEFARQHTLIWVNQVMESLHNLGYQLEIFHGRKYFGPTSARSLERLCRSNPVACWILARSTPVMQAWFYQAKLPTLVAGSTYAEVKLPSVDIDHHALCRHAAGVLFRKGHRRVALLFDRVGHAGDLESELGFLAACAELGTAVFPYISKIEISGAGIIKEVQRLLALRQPPTAFLLSNSFSYLSVSSYLGSIGKLVPHDVSLISRDEEHFLKFLHPVPARYTCPPKNFLLRSLRLSREYCESRSLILFGPESCLIFSQAISRVCKIVDSITFDVHLRETLSGSRPT